MKRALVILFACVSSALWAQQEQQYTQYMVNPYVLNPAIGGTEDYTDLKLGYRTQWVNFGRDNAGPKTFYASMHGTIGKSFRQYHHKGEHGYWHGIGGYIYKDEAGPISTTTFSANYSFNMPITQKIRASLGVFAGLKQFRVNQDWWNFLNLTDPQYAAQYNDQYLSASDFTTLTPDLSVGFWLYSDKWYFGGSAMQLLQNDLKMDGFETIAGQGSGRLYTHVFFMGGYRVQLTDKVNVIPGMAVKAVNPAPLSVDLNVKVDYDDMFFGGINWRLQDSFSAIVGVVINHLVEVSYSYDLTTTNDIRANSSGTHEIVLGIRIKHPKNIDCPSKFW